MTVVPLLHYCFLAVFLQQTCSSTAITLLEGHENEILRQNIHHRRSRDGKILRRNALFNAENSDLTPAAQSYFITPETPPTTTIKPTFTRRKTSRPISSLTEKNKDNANNKPFQENLETPPKVFNPFGQIVNTGFDKDKRKRPLGSRPKSRTDENINGNGGVNYEANEINTTTEGGHGEDPTTKRTINGGRRKKIGSGIGQKPTQSGAIVAPIIKFDRPNRFTFQSQPRRSFARSTTSTSTTTTTTVKPGSVRVNVGDVDIQTPKPRPSFRGGRQFTLRPKPEIASDPGHVENNENRPLRRRKRPTTQATSDSTPTELSIVKKPFGHGQNERPTARKVPDGPIARRNQALLGTANRRNPLLGLKMRSLKQLPEPVVVAINPIENSQVDESPLNRMMRHRPNVNPNRSVSTTTIDSEHESSDAVIVFAASDDNIDSAAPGSSIQLQEESSSSSAPSSSTTELPYIPRNLSNRRTNNNVNENSPLNKLMNNRQAAARRFLTPKKFEASSTTSKPLVQITTRTTRKSPLSLANLKNRRIGGSSSTTTESPAELSENETGALVNSSDIAVVESDVKNGTVSVVSSSPIDPDLKSEDKTEDTKSENISKPESSDDGETKLQKPSPIAGLLKRPPRLPGQLGGAKVARMQALLKPKTTEATTAKPINTETTTPPTCEEGKRYNKILRKCIPSFSHKTG